MLQNNHLKRSTFNSRKIQARTLNIRYTYWNNRR